MGKFQTLGSEELEGVAIRVSRRFGPHRNWKHEEFNCLPQLQFDYDDTDSRFADKSEELRLYRNAYWESELKSGVTNQEQYERDLREAVLKAVDKVKEKWNKKLSEDLNRDFK